MKFGSKFRRIRVTRRNRRLDPVGGQMVRPVRVVDFRSYPIRLEDLYLAPHGILDTVGQPLRLNRTSTPKTIGPNPRRERLVPRLRGPSHRPRID